MHRFYLPPEECNDRFLRLHGREAHHALHVLRLKKDDEVTVLNGAGNIYLCQIEAASKDALSLVVRDIKFVAPLPCALTLLVAVPKGKIIEDIIQKSVELGVQRVTPLLAERVVTHLDTADAEAKREKWQQVAVEAIKQCGAAWLPQVETPATISNVLASTPRSELPLIGSLQTDRRHPSEWIFDFRRDQRRLPDSVEIWIGPEGDFTLEELQSIEAAGAKPITLGDLTLRVETAAIYCLSFLNYELRRPR